MPGRRSSRCSRPCLARATLPRQSKRATDHSTPNDKVARMNRLALAPLALALATLAGCGTSDGGNAGGAPAGGKIAGKAAPAGTTWAATVVETPEGGFRMGNPDAPIK